MLIVHDKMQAQKFQKILLVAEKITLQKSDNV